MKKLVYQKVKIQEVLNKLVENCEDGDLMSASGRAFANVESGNGRVYTFSVVCTLSDDDFCHDYSLPLVDPEMLKNGIGIIKAPEGHLPNGVTLDDKDLQFPEIDDY